MISYILILIAIWYFIYEDIEKAIFFILLGILFKKGDK